MDEVWGRFGGVRAQPTSCSLSLHFLYEDENVISQLLLSGFPCLLSMNSTALELQIKTLFSSWLLLSGYSRTLMGN